MSKDKKGTNYKYGIQLDINGDGGLIDERYVPGSKDYTTLTPFSAAGIPFIFFIAPSPCKIIEATERHVTVAGQAGTMQVEKLASGVAAGSGVVTLASAFDLTSTAETNVTKAALTTAAATLAKGDSLALKVASGAATSYASGSILLQIQYL